MSSVSKKEGWMDLPEILEKWIVAYNKLNEHEYEFFIRDFPVTKVLIKIEKREELNKYYAQVNYNIKRSPEEDFSTLIGKGEKAVQAITEILTQMLTRSEVTEVETNNYYWMILV